MNDSHLQLKYAFGTIAPELTQFPHLVFRITTPPLTAICERAQEDAGIWGERLMVSEEGTVYLEPDDGRIIDQFRLWTLPDNQRYARQFISKAGCFTMGIPANTNVHVLAESYDWFSPSDGVWEYYTAIRRVHEILPDLRWAYLPLVDGDFAMLVAHHDWKWLVDAYRSDLDASNVPVFEITGRGEDQSWNGPALWDGKTG